MNYQTINPTQHAKRRYFWELGLSLAAYAAVLIISRLLLEGPMRHVSNHLHIAIALSPILPVLFMLVAIIRCVLGMDEIMRRIAVNSLAIAGGATALLAVTYGLVEGDPLPKLSAWWTYGTFMSSWLIASFFVRRHYR